MKSKSRRIRKFRRDRKGMETIFGALFFIILLLMGFNLFVWVFVNYDNYNRVIANMEARDQSAIAENLVPQNPGAQNFTSNTFNVVVNNLGIAVSVARIYIVNISPTGGTQCLAATPCYVDGISGTFGSFSNGNVREGEINHLIKVTTAGAFAPINDGSGYKVIITSTRGRDFTFFYPWPVANVNNNPSGNFVTNIGPLAIYFDFKSFNYTTGSQTSSNSAFCVPTSTPLVFWIRIANTATDSGVTLEPQTMMQMQPYSANGFGQFVRAWIDSPTSKNPSTVTAYSMSAPYFLPAAGPSGPAGTTLVYISASSQQGTGAVSFSPQDNWITFIGFYYFYRNQLQGQTIPFMDFKTATGAPGTC